MTEQEIAIDELRAMLGVYADKILDLQRFEDEIRKAIRDLEDVR